MAMDELGNRSDGDQELWRSNDPRYRLLAEQNPSLTRSELNAYHDRLNIYDVEMREEGWESAYVRRDELGKLQVKIPGIASTDSTSVIPGWLQRPDDGTEAI